MRAVLVGFALAACGIANAAGPPLVITAGGHRAHVAFSPDGKAIAAGSVDVLKLFDPAAGKELLTFTGHAWPIHAVAFSPDGRLLASVAGGFRDGKRREEVRLWEAATGKAVLIPVWWEGEDVNAVAFSPDGKAVAAGGSKGLRVWDVAGGKVLKEIETGAAILALAYSPDGKTLAAGAFTQYAHLWDTRTWEERVLKGHKSEIRAVAYSPDGKTLVTGGVGEFKVWDAARELKKTVKHPDTVWSLAFAPDGKHLAVGGGQPRADVKGTASVWDTEGWVERQSWGGEAGMVPSVAFSPDGKLLAAGRFNGAVEVREPAAK